MENIEALVIEVLNGNKERFREIIQQCNLPLYRTAIVILKNEADAEDALQNAYLKAYLHLKAFRHESSFLTWITRILINECKMLLRKKKESASLENEEVMQKPSITENAMDTLYNKQVGQLLEHAVLSLPEKYKLVYVIREVNEFSTERAAATLGISEENVKVRLHRAKTLIRENLLQKVNLSELFPFHKVRCNKVADRVMVAIHNLTLVEKN